MSGLYLHIPFCRQACTYCDFHFSTNLEKKSALVAAMREELKLRKDYLKDRHSGRRDSSEESQNKLSSIYFGGGTPSVLTLDELWRILDTIHSLFEVDKNAEITFELNPEDANAQYLSEIRKMGVNRLSVGLQSFDESELKWMNRIHSAQQSVQCIKEAQKAGLENISIDLIYGSRFQTEEGWKETLEKVFELGVPHISSYNLTIEGRTKLSNLLQKNEEPEVDSELSAYLFDILMEETEKNGFEHYEISNFAKPGFMAAHNSNYWRGIPYLGVGPAAHSFNGLNRSFNVKSNTGYIQAIGSGKKFWEEEILSDMDRYNEYVLTRLRTAWGCDLDEIAEQFGHKYKEYFLKNLHLHEQYIVRDKNKITLNQKGKHFADGIASDLFLVTDETE